MRSPACRARSVARLALGGRHHHHVAQASHRAACPVAQFAHQQELARLTGQIARAALRLPVPSGSTLTRRRGFGERPVAVQQPQPDRAAATHSYVSLMTTTGTSHSARRRTNRRPRSRPSGRPGRRHRARTLRSSAPGSAVRCRGNGRWSGRPAASSPGRRSAARRPPAAGRARTRSWRPAAGRRARGAARSSSPARAATS